jgi:hypothetical protein
MTPVHPEFSFTVNPAQAAADAERVCVSGTFPLYDTCNLEEASVIGFPVNDIFTINPYTNQKKEVTDIEMNEIQHCKSIQYNT